MSGRGWLPAVGLTALTGIALAAGCREDESAARAAAAPTRVIVRAVARDAKIIGSGVGGAMVRIEDANTGRVLAEGKQEGGTGDTRLIMTTPRKRGATTFATEGAASFVAELSLSEPTEVTITATGPTSYPQAVASTSKRMLLLPGMSIEGDGVVLELHGFIVEIQSPQPMTLEGDSVIVKARVRMLCGCPIEPGGLWDAGTKRFVARLKSGGVVVATAPLDFGGTTSIFTGTIEVPAAARDGELSLEVLVSEPGTQNFGRDEIELSRQSNRQSSR